MTKHVENQAVAISGVKHGIYDNNQSIYNNKHNLHSNNNAFSLIEDDLLLLTEYLLKRNKDTTYIKNIISFIRDSTNLKVSPSFSDKVIGILSNKIKYERSLATEVEDVVNSTEGVFYSTDLTKILQLSTTQDLKNLSVILRRLAKKGFIEKYGNKNGCWRKIDTVADEIDFINADESGIDLKFPFYIEDLYIPQSKNVAVIAGEPDAGKSAFLFNFAKLNMEKHNIYYFSSEMGGNELKSRLNKFGLPLDKWKVKFIERASNFEDVVKPNDINIIDFLEITQDFWRVGEHITNVFRRLDKGFAFIALQKNRSKTLKDGTITGEFGLGGQRGLEKPRLYLTLGHRDNSHVAKILKCKNWRHEDLNPNNLELEFSLRKGCEFVIRNHWNKDGVTKGIKETRGALGGFVREE